MIRRLFLQELLSFERVELEFDNGLIVLSGPSGAGKSLLMSSILSLLGIGNTQARTSEIELNGLAGISSTMYDIDEEVVIRSIKKEKTRHYLDEQNISKKSLKAIFAPYLNHLSVRDSGGFESEKLLRIFDESIKNKNASYKKLLKEYKKRYATYKAELQRLEKIRQDEKDLANLIEFTSFEIDKIKSIDPKIGEDEELMTIKKQLSRIDKINDALSQAEAIFALEDTVGKVYELCELDGSMFTDAMNQLRSDFDYSRGLSTELEGTDVESLLDRLEKITDLKSRYGSIEEAISYRIQKEQELLGYKTIEQDKSTLVAFLELEQRELTILAMKIRQSRKDESVVIANTMQEYLARLKLPAVSFDFDESILDENGADIVQMRLANSGTSKLSGGEHNRLRLALLVASLQKSTSHNAIIVLDEIDANVSGDESIAIAQMIAKLASHYQIFAISHQPHLAAIATQHILVEKPDGISQALLLDHDGRVSEISRIIGGENADEKAVAFAEELLRKNQ